jgi:hypothetical protein
MMPNRYPNYDYLHPPRDVRDLIEQKFKCEGSLSAGKAFIFYFHENSLDVSLRYNVEPKTFYYEGNYYTTEQFRRILNLLAFA